MAMIRCLLLGLIFTLAPGLAAATPPGANTVIVRNVEQPIGVVAFDGRDGSRVTKVLRESLSKRLRTGSEREIRLIDHKTFDETVKKAGSEAKAAQTLAEKLGLGSVIFGAVKIYLYEEITTPVEKNCSEMKELEKCNKQETQIDICKNTINIIRFKFNFFRMNDKSLSQSQIEDVSNDFIYCGRNENGIANNNPLISGLIGVKSNHSDEIIEYFDKLIIERGVKKFLSELINNFSIEIDSSILSLNYNKTKTSTFNSGRESTTISQTSNSNGIESTPSSSGSISGAIISGNVNINAASVGVAAVKSGQGSATQTNVGASNSTLNNQNDDAIGASVIIGSGNDKGNRFSIETSKNYKKTSITTSIGISSGKNTTNPEAMSEPPFFPWPPPRPSLFGEISSNFDVSEDLADVDRQIRAHLVKRSYESLHYFGVVGGFVVTTDLERITTDGLPAKNDRWLIGKSGRTSSFTEYIKNLIFGEKGRFRMFAFVVSDREPGAAPYLATEQDTLRMKTNGAMMLSARTGAIETSASTRVWLYVYEFESALNKSDTIVALIDNVVPLAAHKRSLGLK